MSLSPSQQTLLTKPNRNERNFLGGQNENEIPFSAENVKKKPTLEVGPTLETVDVASPLKKMSGTVKCTLRADSFLTTGFSRVIPRTLPTLSFPVSSSTVRENSFSREFPISPDVPR